MCTQARAGQTLLNSCCAVTLNGCCDQMSAYSIQTKCPLDDNTYATVPACTTTHLGLPNKGEFIFCAVSLNLKGSYSSISDIITDINSRTYQVLSDDCVDIFPAIVLLHGVSTSYEQPIGQLIADTKTSAGCLARYSALVGFTPQNPTVSGTYEIIVNSCSSQSIQYIVN